MPAFVGILEGETRPERTGDVEDEADGFWDRGVGGVVGGIRIELSRQAEAFALQTASVDNCIRTGRDLRGEVLGHTNTRGARRQVFAIKSSSDQGIHHSNQIIVKI